MINWRNMVIFFVGHLTGGALVMMPFWFKGNWKVLLAGMAVGYLIMFSPSRLWPNPWEPKK